MEVLKKQIKQITTTATTIGGDIITIPDSGVSYNFKIALRTRVKDYGFFDYVETTGATAVTYNSVSTVTGTSKSRLAEIRKFKVSGDLNEIYFTSNSPASDGLDLFFTETGGAVETYRYYIGGITYTDVVQNGVSSTTFSFLTSGTSNTNNFVNGAIIKDFAKEDSIDQPEVDDDVFIIRQSLSVFEDQYRIANLNTLSDLLDYAGGSHFTVVNNT